MIRASDKEEAARDAYRKLIKKGLAAIPDHEPDFQLSAEQSPEDTDEMVLMRDEAVPVSYITSRAESQSIDAQSV